MNENKPLTAVRGIAALYVVGYHLNAWIQPNLVPRGLFAFGYSAVDLSIHQFEDHGLTF